MARYANILNDDAWKVVIFTPGNEELADRLFPLLFEASEFANMDIDKQLKVSEIMRTELDRIAENNFAREQGLKQGLAEGRAEEKRFMASKLRDLGVDIAIISQATDLSEEEIRAL